MEIRFFLHKEFVDGTEEKTYCSQVEAFQGCSKAMTDAVFEKHKTGSTNLAYVEWGAETASGEVEVIEFHNLVANKSSEDAEK